MVNAVSKNGSKNRPSHIPLNELPDKTRLWFLLNARGDFAAAIQAIGFSNRWDGASGEFGAFSELAVVRYCRPFGACNLLCGKHNTRLSKSFRPQRVRANINSFYDVLFSIRDGSAAHSDLQSRTTYVSFEQPTADRKMPLGWSTTYAPLYLGVEDLHTLEGLATFHIEWIEDEAGKLLPLLDPLLQGGTKILMSELLRNTTCPRCSTAP